MSQYKFALSVSIESKRISIAASCDGFGPVERCPKIIGTSGNSFAFSYINAGEENLDFICPE